MGFGIVLLEISKCDKITIESKMLFSRRARLEQGESNVHGAFVLQESGFKRFLLHSSCSSRDSGALICCLVLWTNKRAFEPAILEQKRAFLDGMLEPAPSSF